MKIYFFRFGLAIIKLLRHNGVRPEELPHRRRHKRKKRSRPDMERDRHGLPLSLAILALPTVRVLVTPAIGRCIRLTV